MKKQLEGKTAIVTGGGGGIGKAICLEFAKHGASVAVTDINLCCVQEASRMISRLGLKAKAYRMDVADKNEVDHVFNQVLKEFGRLDLLINNAGISMITSFEKISEKEWDQILVTNLKGTFLCSQAAFKAMKLQKGGRIINIASGASRSGGMVTPGLYNPYAHYAASKAGIESLTRSMAYEGAPYGILVNAVSPGPIETDLSKKTYPPQKRRRLLSSIPIHRFGRPEEIASAVTFLASDRAVYITGKVLDVNGGLLMD